jgi:hypothetical protein
VKFLDAIELERGRVLLEGQAAEDHRRQVAAIDRQARPGWQAGCFERIVGSATRTYRRVKLGRHVKYQKKQSVGL